MPLTSFVMRPHSERLGLLLIWMLPGATIAPAERSALFSATSTGMGPTDGCRLSFASVLERVADVAPLIPVREQHFSRRKLWFTGGPPVISATVPRLSDTVVIAEIDAALTSDADTQRLARALIHEALAESRVAHPTRPLHAMFPRVRENVMHFRSGFGADPDALMDKVCDDIPDNHILDAALDVLARYPRLADDAIVDRLDALAQRPEEHIAFSLAKRLAPVSSQLPHAVTLFLLALALRRSKDLGRAQAFVARMILDRYDDLGCVARDLASRAFTNLVACGHDGPAGVICARISEALCGPGSRSVLLASPHDLMSNLAASEDHGARGSVADVLYSCPAERRAQFGDLEQRLRTDPSPYVRTCLAKGQSEAEEEFW